MNSARSGAIAAVALAAILLACGVRAASPSVGYIYPAALRMGTTNRILVGGQSLYGVHDGFVSGNGVKVLKVEHVPSFILLPNDQRRYLIKWLAAIAKGQRDAPPIPEDAKPDEWRTNSWWNALGKLDAQQLSIAERWLHTPRNPLQIFPALRQKLLVTVAVAPDAEPGVREFRVFSPAGMSAPRPLLLTAGETIEEPLYVPPMRPKPETPCVKSLPCVLNGQILPGQTDSFKLRLQGGHPVTLRTVARELQPYIGDAVPGFFNPVLRILDAAGAEVAFADDYRYHPDPVMVFTPPATGEYTLQIRDNLYRGRDDFVYSVEIRDGAWAPPFFGLPLTPMPDATVPGEAMVAVVRGCVQSPGAEMVHEICVPEAGEYVFDLLARRAGSPLDGRIVVCGADGEREIARFDDVTNAVHVGSVIQGECDPVGTCRLEKAGRHVVKITDESGAGGGDFFYTLRVRRPVPRVELYAHRSSFAVSRGQRVPVDIDVVRLDGFDGTVTLLTNAFFAVENPVVPAASNRVVVTLRATVGKACPPSRFDWSARVEAGGRTRIVPVVPSDEYNQAFAWDHILPAREFVAKVYPPAVKRPVKRKDGK